MNILLIVLVVLAAFLIYVAWKNDWDFKIAIAALGAVAVAAWEAAKAVSYTHLTLPTTPYV